jgi:hypothetical protein
MIEQQQSEHIEISPYSFLTFDRSNKVFKYSYKPNQQSPIKSHTEKEEAQIHEIRPSQQDEEQELNTYEATQERKSSPLMDYESNTFLFICINLSEHEAANLQKTLKSLYDNIPDLSNNLGIGIKKILIFVFFEGTLLNTLNINTLFPDSKYVFKSLKGNEFMCNLCQFSYKKEEIVKEIKKKGVEKKKEADNKDNEANIQNNNQNENNNQNINIDEENIPREFLEICLINKANLSKSESHRVFLYGFCEDLKTKHKPQIGVDSFMELPFFCLFLKAGMCPEVGSLKTMIKSLTWSEANEELFTFSSNQAVIARGAIELISRNKKFSIFPEIQKYQYFSENIYDNHLKSLSSSIELEERFFMMKIHSNTFYKIDLSMIGDLFSFKNEQFIRNLFMNKNLANPIIYLPDAIAYYDASFTFEELMEDSSEKISSYLNSYNLLLDKICTCRNNAVGILGRITAMLNLFKLFVTFSFPGLFTFTMYIIFMMSFVNVPASIFFVVFYNFLFFITSIISLIGTVEELRNIFYIFYIVFGIFYVFVIICAIVAINNARTIYLLFNFNTDAFIVFIILNFCFVFIPLCLNFRRTIKNLAQMPVYLWQGLFAYSSLFLINGVLNIKLTNKPAKALYIMTFFICNLFFSYLIFVMENNIFKLNQAVLGLAIIFTIYYALKFAAILCDYIIYYSSTRKKMDLSLTKITNFIYKFYEEKLERMEAGKVKLRYKVSEEELDRVKQVKQINKSMDSKGSSKSKGSNRKKESDDEGFHHPMPDSLRKMNTSSPLQGGSDKSIEIKFDGIEIINDDSQEH